MWNVEEFGFWCFHQKWSISAGCWRTCVQWPVCSSGLRTKLKIRCSSPERHGGSEWKTDSYEGQEKPKVTALPRWCVCELSTKEECSEGLWWLSHTASFGERVQYSCLLLQTQLMTSFKSPHLQLPYFPWRPHRFGIAIFGTPYLLLTWEFSISSICCSAGLFSLCFVLFVLHTCLSCDNIVWIIKLGKNYNTKGDKSLLLSHSLQTPKKEKLYFGLFYLLSQFTSIVGSQRASYLGQRLFLFKLMS